jgi:hypothetical protein
MPNLIHLRAKCRFMIDSGAYKRGDLVIVSEALARHLLEIGNCTTIGPAEIKPAGPTEKKSPSEFPTDGPLIDLASSSAPGTDTPSSASVAAPVSPAKRSRNRKASTPPAEGELPQ